MTPPFRHPLTVRYSDCDPQGVVFNGNYLTYFDIAVGELWRASAMGGWQRMVAEIGVDAHVAESTVRYLKPMTFDEDVELLATVTHIGNTSLKIELAIERDGERVAEGENRYVFVAPDGGGKTRVPDAVRDALAPWSDIVNS